MDLQTLIKDAKERFGFEEAGALNVEALEFCRKYGRCVRQTAAVLLTETGPARRDAARWKRFLGG